MNDDLTLLLLTLGVLLLAMILLLGMMGYLRWLFHQDAQKRPRNASPPAFPSSAATPPRPRPPPTA